MLYQLNYRPKCISKRERLGRRAPITLFNLCFFVQGVLALKRTILLELELALNVLAVL